METTDVSPQYKATSLSAPSPTASHIACLTGARLQIRSLVTFELVRNIPLPQTHDVRRSQIAWSPPSASPSGASTPPRRSSVLPPRSHRILVADDDTTRVYDLRHDNWTAVISNGSGGMGKNVTVEFGRDEDEVLIWSDFASRAMAWSLKTGRTVDIRDPKFSGKDGRGWGYRPCSEEQGVGGRGSVLALLCRSPGVDMLMLLAPKTYDVINRVELTTQDAQGVRWSSDGRWLAIWDAASVGYSLCIYTADGHLYRTISRELPDEPSEWGIEGLGIKTVEWVPGDDWLAVGGWDRRVRILSTKTFSPVVYLDHTAEICVPSASVYMEQIDARGFRSFEVAQQPATPPKAPVEKNDTGLMKQGISAMAFNKDGTLCATRDDSTPTTVWIWDLRSLQPRTILILQSPVKALQWHPSHPSHLLIQSVHDSPTLYLYTAHPFASSTSSSDPTTGPPTILSLADNIAKPVGSAPAKWSARWLTTEPDQKPAMVVGHQQGYILVWPQGKDQILRFQSRDDDDDDGDESDDSLYDILTGRTPVPPLRNSASRHSCGSEDAGEDGYGTGARSVQGLDGTGSLDDTFREKREATGGDKSVFDESGLDEMF